jgi:hypothetical protein
MLTLDPDSNRQFIIIRNHQDIAVCTTELNEQGQLISQTTAEFDSQNRIRGFFCYTAAAGRITACRIYHYHTPPFTQEDGFADYRDTGNGLQLLCYTHSYHINAQTARCDWFDAQGELAYYDWFVHDPDIGEHIYAGTYLPHETEHLPANQIQPYLPVHTD